MRLHYLKIEGFRRHVNTEIFFSDATFLIGENNLGKSSVLVALNYLLSDTKRISDEEFFCVRGEDGTNIRFATKIVLTAEFRNIPVEAETWRGFKGRLLPYEVEEGSSETGLRILFKKTYEPNKDYVVEMREHKRTLKTDFLKCQTPNDYISAGLEETLVKEICGDINLDKKLTGKPADSIKQLDELYDVDETQEAWVSNPGGIPGNVLHRMPKFLLIPAQDRSAELDATNGALVKTLNELFNDVRNESENYKQAQHFLNQLALELDPSDHEKEFGKMMMDLNKVLSDVFPDAGIHANTSLADPNTVIKPLFNITMYSNVVTSVALQGTGMIRAAVFALLRYRNIRENNKGRTVGSPTRPLLIGFEEPEIYLHPNASNQLRDTIYSLAGSKSNQIICTTHSPYMIDLSQKPSQTLNNICLFDGCEIEVSSQVVQVEGVKAYPFNTTRAFKQLQGNDKTYVKMLLKIDDYVARVFFVKNVLIIEGDTEDIVLRESIIRMPHKVQQDIIQNWQIIKARGKATISSLVKYLKSMGIDPVVIHDEDSETPMAAMHNQPILEAIGNASKRFMLTNCIEDVLGYEAPINEKPFTAYRHIKDNWGDEWASVPSAWRQVVERVFDDSFALMYSTDTSEQDETLLAIAVTSDEITAM